MDPRYLSSCMICLTWLQLLLRAVQFVRAAFIARPPPCSFLAPLSHFSSGDGALREKLLSYSLHRFQYTHTHTYTTLCLKIQVAKEMMTVWGKWWFTPRWGAVYSLLVPVSWLGKGGTSWAQAATPSWAYSILLEGEHPYVTTRSVFQPITEKRATVTATIML